MHQQFNIQQLYVLPTLYYVFCIYLRTNSDLYHLQHKLIGFYNRDGKCLLRGTNWVFKSVSYTFVLKRLSEVVTSVSFRDLNLLIWVLCSLLKSWTSVTHRRGAKPPPPPAPKRTTHCRAGKNKSTLSNIFVYSFSPTAIKITDNIFLENTFYVFYVNDDLSSNFALLGNLNTDLQTFLTWQVGQWNVRRM